MVVVAGLKRQRRVSWARDDNLCKVRLFLSEDAPSQSGFGAQDHLQAKAAWLLHTAGVVDSDDSLPPGFEKLHKLRRKTETSQIPIIKWQRPPRLAINPEWLVAAGEESQEVAIENQRHLGVLEAVYPRPSSIPPNPAVVLGALDATVNDSQTPLIPITATEEEDATEESDAVSVSNCAPVQSQSYPVDGSRQRIAPPDVGSSLRQPPSQPSEGSQIPNVPNAETPSMAAAMVTALAGMAPGAEPDFVAAASAAFTAIVKSSEEGSLVDRDLLIKILSNPGMIERLASEYGGPKQQPKQNPPALATQPVAGTSAGAPPKHGSLPPASQHVAAASAPPPLQHVSLPMASQHVASASAGAPPHRASSLPLPLPRTSQHVASTSAGAPPHHASSLPLPRTSQHVASTPAGAPPHNASSLPLPRTSQHVASTSAGAPPKHASLPLPSQYMASTSVAIPPPPPPPPPPGHTQISAISPLSAPVRHSFQLPNMIRPSTMNTHRPPGQMPTIPPVNAPVVKDANYYKSLIQLHGGEKQEALQFKNGGHQFSSPGSLQHGYHHHNNNMIGSSNMVEAFGRGVQKQTDTRVSKVSRPCVYFNTPRGCRHGAGCLFQHDGSVHRAAFEQQQGAAKRIKLDREIGRSN
ncbi:zinc finger CCCH domain-containing protein 30 [Iris pallida]|uniref:Zinc finger CCCH domain-containing protein 30 n=1 Tax=Iris pallida TaxID=29817 RepID=A0AAX6HBB9_IRIPA|nr:zinc finger CCCH domain-containing protein 30 [Iris pallida]